MEDRSKKLIFLHIPKTGVSTLHTIIHREYKKGEWMSTKNHRDAARFGQLPTTEKEKIIVYNKVIFKTFTKVIKIILTIYSSSLGLDLIMYFLTKSSTKTYIKTNVRINSIDSFKNLPVFNLN